MIDKVRDKAVRVIRQVPLARDLTLWDDLHKYITLEGWVITTRCDDICERAFNSSQLARAREGDDYLSSLSHEEVEENYIKPLLFLLSKHKIRPRDLLPPRELQALIEQAGPRWPRNLTDS